MEKTTIALIIGSGAAFAVAFFSLIAFLIYRRLHPIGSIPELNKSFSHEFRNSRRSSTHDELYHNHHHLHHSNNKKPPPPILHGGSDGSSMENPFTTTQGLGFSEDDDPDLIPSKNGKEIIF